MAELTLNPHTELVLITREGDVVEITAAAPIRGRALAITAFSKAEHPGEFHILQRLAERNGALSVELTRAERDRLRAAGLLVPKDAIPKPVQLRSPLADPPRELVPRSRHDKVATRTRTAKTAELRVNPSLRSAIRSRTQSTEFRAASRHAASAERASSVWPLSAYATPSVCHASE